MNNLKYSLYIIGAILVSSASLFIAAIPDMNQVGRVMFSVFGFSGFALLITYMTWRIKGLKKAASSPKIVNREPVRRATNLYYRKKVA